MNIQQVKELCKLLPTTQEVEKCLEGQVEDVILISWAIEDLKRIFEAFEVVPWDLERETTFCSIKAFLERCWERIHTGKFCNISDATRQAYALANYFKIFYTLIKSVQIAQLEECMETLDQVKLLGITSNTYKRCQELDDYIENYLNINLEGLLNFNMTPVRIKYLPFEQRKCDIEVLYNPPVAVFETKHFNVEKPVLIKDSIKNWPATEKWRDLNYLLKLGGNRSVPVEIGANYTDVNWSQSLVKFRDFLQRQFANESEKSNDIEYLAQHNLFEQIPALRRDIMVPDYCVLGEDDINTVDIKAWLGPSGTVSPLHFDAKHNILCQVFGAKTLILAAPDDSPNIYAHDSEVLGNTSRIIDAENINLEKFPNAANIKFYHVPLLEGSCVYIPPKWWHYVRAETPSFSVSFWWN